MKVLPQAPLSLVLSSSVIYDWTHSRRWAAVLKLPSSDALGVPDGSRSLDGAWPNGVLGTYLDRVGLVRRLV